MPSLEMLKKLLDEFSEKEAHTREEINVITEQIGELEKRILTSQQKLATVAVDREKVRAMQARYSGGSTLTPGTPLLGSRPVASDSSSEEIKDKEPRPRPGRAASSPSTSTTQDVIPVAPLNVRASSTRIPAMAPPEPAPTPVAESNSFLNAFASPTPAPAAATEPAAAPKAFSPMDLFGSPADEPEPVSSAPIQPEPQPLTPDYSTGASYNAGVSYDYQNAQPIEPLPGSVPPPVLEPAPTAPVAPNPPASTAPTGTSSIGEITTSFFTPMGSTEATLQPSSPFAQPPAVDASTQHSLFLDPNQQPQAAQPDDAAQVQDLDEDEPDDTVKSINDALRGLFR